MSTGTRVGLAISIMVSRELFPSVVTLSERCPQEVWLAPDMPPDVWYSFIGWEDCPLPKITYTIKFTKLWLGSSTSHSVPAALPHLWHSHALLTSGYPSRHLSTWHSLSQGRCYSCSEVWLLLRQFDECKPLTVNVVQVALHVWKLLSHLCKLVDAGEDLGERSVPGTTCFCETPLYHTTYYTKITYCLCSCYQGPCYKAFPLCFVLGILHFQVLHLNIIHFELLFCGYCQIRATLYSFACGCPFSPILFLKETVLFLL